MTEWVTHWLEAEGSLERWKPMIEDEIEKARQAVASVVPPPALDILMGRRGAEAVMAEDGLYGFANGPSLLTLFCHPENPSFAASLDGALARVVVHEVHHCLRMAGPGYGETLGEALVSEGLAGHFVQRLLGTPPERWETALDPATLAAHGPDDATLASTDYDHAAWFFGTGSLPRWLGYSLGHALVGDWLARSDSPDADAWVHTPAATILAAAAGRR